jgi:hypothetical protein
VTGGVPATLEPEPQVHRSDAAAERFLTACVDSFGFYQHVRVFLNVLRSVSLRSVRGTGQPVRGAVTEAKGGSHNSQVTSRKVH